MCSGQKICPIHQSKLQNDSHHIAVVVLGGVTGPEARVRGMRVGNPESLTMTLVLDVAEPASFLRLKCF